MTSESVEVNSALWQKIFAYVVALPFIAVGLACSASPWLPIFSGPAPPPPALAIALGLLLGGFFFCFCFWPVMRYSIRADSEGISQFNGFFRQSVRWSQVESYYLDFNPRYHAERRYHIEPFLLDARSEIAFQGFAHLLKSTRKIIEQRRELWRFVELQLSGKRIEKPFTVSDAQIEAAQSFETVKWAGKSLAWKIARAARLGAYAAICLTLALAPSYWVISRDIRVSEPVKLLLIAWMLLVFVAPILVRGAQVSLREKRLLRERRVHDES